ncbi:MAG: tRNA pseudouridine(38-40) synthase TruA [Sphingomonadales bacterium]|nr:tRNA pseudouridine(38-40) synthase TruA [Sphingomonadales bacterium]
MTRFMLTIEYDGRPFVGMQAQDNGLAVQKVVEDAIFAFSHTRLRITTCGRTDRGVHARGQVIHFDLETDMTPYKIMAAINALMRPHPVVAIDCKVIPDDISARFSATTRHYTYRIINRTAPLAIDKGLAWHVPHHLDEAAMHDAAQVLVGHHDFTTFRAIQCQGKSPMKTLDRLDVERIGDEINIHASSRSFLHHQVRSMVGSLKMVGEGKWTKADLKASLEAKDRKALGFNAPPDGLYFMKVDYPDI